MRKFAIIATLSVLTVARFSEFEKEKFFDMIHNSEGGREVLS